MTNADALKGRWQPPAKRQTTGGGGTRGRPHRTSANRASRCRRRRRPCGGRELRRPSIGGGGGLRRPIGASSLRLTGGEGTRPSCATGSRPTGRANGRRLPIGGVRCRRGEGVSHGPRRRPIDGALLRRGRRQPSGAWEGGIGGEGVSHGPRCRPIDGAHLRSDRRRPSSAWEGREVSQPSGTTGCRPTGGMVSRPTPRGDVPCHPIGGVRASHELLRRPSDGAFHRRGRCRPSFAWEGGKDGDRAGQMAAVRPGGMQATIDRDAEAVLV